MATDAVQGAARAWLADDPDPSTSTELQRILDAGDGPALAESFGARLSFGTAGIRGPLGPGPNRMNVRVVRQLAAAVAAWCGAGPVVVGHDARHRSADFAGEAASVLAGAGVPAVLLPGPVPTPVLAFAVRHLECTAGLMVTASHNPRTDNGVKVYDGSGAQIVPPADVHIAAGMDSVGSVRSLAVGRPELAGADVLDAYLDAAAARVPDGPRQVTIVHTALHGVATAPLCALLARAGFAPPHVVAVQAEPDPAFPTVTYPNPEEPGALDLALDEGTRVGADVVIANDPDGDRLAVAVPEGGRGWRVLTGDEIGALLGDQSLRGSDGPGRVVASSLESSTLLGKLAAEHGALWRQTLTGVKWIVRAADPGAGERLVFGYEQALGYVVHDLVRDKDGLTAAAGIAALAAECKAQGSTLLDRLDDLARRHGLHATRQWSLRVEGLEGTQRVSEAVRRLAAAPPAALAGLAVARVEEPAPDVVVLWLAGGSRVIARPSGTEPKLKTYGLVVESDPGAWARVPARLDALRSAVATELGFV